MVWGVPKSLDNILEKVLNNDPKLTSLHIFQGKSFEREDVTKLSKGLASNTHVIELYASGHDLPESSVEEIAGALSQNSYLQTLCLGNSSFGDEKTCILAKGLGKNRTLRVLDLENRLIHESGAAAIGNALIEGLQIQKLFLNRNPIGDEGVFELARGIKCSTHLQVLELSNCNIRGEGIKSLALAIADHSSLKVLRLDENEIGEDGCAYLSNALASATSNLKELHLNECKYGDTGLKNLCVNGFGTVEILHCDNCNLTQATTEALYRALVKSKVRALHLKHNQIGDEGIGYIALAVKECSHLEEIYVGHNALGLPAVEILNSPSNIKILNLEGCNLANAGGFLSKVLSAHTLTKLRELELTGCNLTYPDVYRVFEVLQGCAAPALEILLLAENPATKHADFPTAVRLLTTSRSDIDVVWQSASHDAPLAADGGPPVFHSPPSWNNIKNQ